MEGMKICMIWAKSMPLDASAAFTKFDDYVITYTSPREVATVAQGKALET